VQDFPGAKTKKDPIFFPGERVHELQNPAPFFGIPLSTLLQVMSVERLGLRLDAHLDREL